MAFLSAVGALLEIDPGPAVAVGVVSVPLAISLPLVRGISIGANSTQLCLSLFESFGRFLQKRRGRPEAFD